MKANMIAKISIFIALIVVSGFISFPIGLPVPIVVQNMMVMAVGFFLGKKYGVLTLFIFLLGVALGLPFLSGGRGGLANMIGPSSGYLLGWLCAPFFIGYLLEKVRTLTFRSLFTIFFIAGVLLVNLFGAISIAYLTPDSKLTLLDGLKATAVFIPIDTVKAALLTLICLPLSNFREVG